MNLQKVWSVSDLSFFFFFDEFPCFLVLSFWFPSNCDIPAFFPLHKSLWYCIRLISVTNVYGNPFIEFRRFVCLYISRCWKVLILWLTVDVERHARDFMEAAKKLQLYFIGLQREDQPTKAETLRKVNPQAICSWYCISHPLLQISSGNLIKSSSLRIWF